MGRNTVQRRIILAELQKMNTHPTIEEVWTEVQKEHPAISRTTVYRNLRHLAEGGFIRQVVLPGGLERYDRSTMPHHHFKCNKCENIVDVDIEYHGDIDQAIQEKYGLMVDRHDIVFTGICLSCQKNKKK
ncbi:MAG: transcriptional repressor [Treponema sp.]|nr:transcriptional repressor [Treponema sp.]